MDRRELLAAGAALMTAACAPKPRAVLATEADSDVHAIRDRIGGRVGVAALDTGTGRRIAIDGDARYAMCSTFKVALAAAVLARVDRGELSLDAPVAFSRADLVPYAPVVERHLDAGVLSVAALCEAIVTVSDNVAANLLLRRIGGPAELTRFLRSHGDSVTRLDRFEPELNIVAPGDPRDTTTPNAMLATLQRLTLGKVLAPPSRARLNGWLVDATTGLKRLRAGLPADWHVGDKTGTSGDGKANDIAVAWPPGRAPILIACYVDAPDATAAARDAAHADVACVVVKQFLG